MRPDSSTAGAGDGGPAGSAVATRSLRGPLHDRHRVLGALFADHGGWLMPESYGDPVGEHRATRAAAGLFDLSHLGGVQVIGPEARAALDYALLGDMSRLSAGSARHTLMLDPAGGIIDDMVVYAPAVEEILVVPTAARAAVVVDELVTRTAEFQAEVADVAAASFQLAVQGPRARRILADAGAWREPGTEPAAARTCRFTVVGGCPVLVGSMSYTGEEGFEVIGRVGDAGAVWSALRAAGAGHGLRPAGLRARSTLRIEAGRPRVGAEMDRTTTPYDVGLRHLVPQSKEEPYVGREGLVAALQEGPDRTLAGLVGTGSGAPAPGAAVIAPHGGIVGCVTSACVGPSAGVPVALARIDAHVARGGGRVTVAGRPMRIAEPPFHRAEPA